MMAQRRRDSILAVILVFVAGTIVALLLGIERAWPLILPVGIWIVGGGALLGLGILELRARRRKI